MADSDKKKEYSWVDWDGRFHVNVDVLLADPKVRETIRRVSKMHERLRNKPGFTFVRRVRPDEA
jgi:hypothetical protein